MEKNYDITIVGSGLTGLSVSLALSSLGYKIALLSVCLYLLEGIIGFPVFSNSPERGVGWVYFTGPTMGYLLGFISACYLASFIKVKDNYLIIFF